MYHTGCVGLALNTLHAVAHPPNPPSGPNSGVNTPLTRKEFSKGRGTNGGRNARFGRDGICDPRGKEMIDEALALFDSYPDCPFGDSHPWAMELGTMSCCCHILTSQCIPVIPSSLPPFHAV